MIADYNLRDAQLAGTPLQTLKARLAGDLLLPNDDRYGEAHRGFVGNFDNRRPGAIVRAGDAIDVIRAVTFAREQGLAVAIRSGGHSLAGFNTIDGGLLIDLSELKSMSVDPDRRVARVQPGLTWKEYALQAQEYGLATSSGDVGSVGVGGLILGGGIGWMVRKHGLTIDHLVSADVVTADGRLLTASAVENPDLFWALRGGGGNFGIVTSFELDLKPAGTILGGALFFSYERAREILAGYLQIANEAPDELSTQGLVITAPPLPFIPAHLVGQPIVGIAVAYTGDLEQGEKVVAKLRALGTPIADLVGPMPYPGMFQLTEGLAVKGKHHAMRSTYLNQVDEGMLDAVVEAGATMTSPGGLLQFRVLGGAMARVPEGATAFAHRDKPYMLSLINAWQGEDLDGRHTAWTSKYWDKIQGYGSGVYVNFLEEEGEARTREAYRPKTYDRLAAIKRYYDPSNFFNRNQNIKPAA